MINETEQDEREYLTKIIDKLEDAYIAVDENVTKASKQLQEQKNYLYENKTGMDAAEKASVKQTVNMQAISGEAAVAYKKRLQKLIHDWRAPVSSMFYDFEPGQASFAGEARRGFHWAR